MVIPCLFNNIRESVLNKTKILVVEDDYIISADLEFVLKKRGYNVTSIATNYNMALSSISTNSPHLILMDIGIAGDLDGIDVATIIKNKYEIPVIFLTSHLDKITIERALKTEPYAYIMKPVNKDELFISIEIALYRKEIYRDLKESEYKYRMIFEKSSEAIFLTDENGNFLETNESTLVLLKLTEKEILKSNFFSFLDPAGKKKFLENFKNRRNINNFRTKLTLKNKGNITCIVNAIPFFHENNIQKKVFQIILHDITEQMKIEKRVFESLTRERQRIGQQIHDGLGQILTGTGFLCELLIKKIGDDLPEIKDRAKEIFNLIQESKNESRIIAREFNNSVFHDNGLFSLIEEMTERISKIYNIDFELSFNHDIIFEDDIVPYNIYYIVVESVNNAVKYSRCSKIKIKIDQIDETIHLLVSDKGKGFLLEEASKNKGMGLNIIKYRLDLLGASLTIKSIPGKGTEIFCII